MSNIDIEETKRNIDFWEGEVKKALNENNIWKAVQCRILANQLRKDIEEDDEVLDEETLL